jgi:hypothetical protein
LILAPSLADLEYTVRAAIDVLDLEVDPLAGLGSKQNISLALCLGMDSAAVLELYLQLAPAELFRLLQRQMRPITGMTKAP